MRFLNLMGGVMMTAIVAACGGSPSTPAAPSDTVTIKGSDTLLPLVTPWAEEYMKDHPTADVSVTGGGSGTGIAALLNGTTDICSASREMSKEEQAKAAANTLKIAETVVARDGIAIIVNPANAVNELSLEQLRKIYTGAAAKWSDVGGADQDIIALSRESSSGTFVYFQERVLNKEDYATQVRLMPATSAIIQSVENDATAIGYVGLGHAHEAAGKVKIIAVRDGEGKPAVQASEEAVLSGAYPISRDLYFYTPDPPTAAAKQFMDYCLSEPAQKIAAEAGFVPVKK